MTYIGVNAEWLKEHDEQVKKEERERVLDKLYTSCECIPLKEYASDYDRGFHQAMTLAREWNRSLREGERK